MKDMVQSVAPMKEKKLSSMQGIYLPTTSCILDF